MDIKVLCDDTTFNGKFSSEHGLSLLITTEKHVVLFDVGQTDVFRKNAEELGVDLSKVDTVVLSHGHYDHCNGLVHFLEKNSDAKIYLHRDAFGGFMNGEKYIGVTPFLKEKAERLVLLDEPTTIDEELSIRLASELPPCAPSLLTVQREGKHFSDPFDHEIYLVCRDKNSVVLFTGCSHRGIVQIASMSLSEGATHLVGGFHLTDTMPRGELYETIKALAELPLLFYTGHCLSETARDIMREVGGNKFRPLGAGNQFALGSRAEVACALFRQGYNCSQAVIGAFASDMNLELDTAMKIASSFGGGIGRMREVCGAVSGMMMVCGLTRGYATPETGEIKAEHYRLVQEMASRFRNVSGSIICRELLGGTASSLPTPTARTPEFYQKRPCERLIHLAASIAEEYCVTK